MDITEKRLFEVLDELMKDCDNKFVVDIGCSTNSHFLKYNCTGVLFDLDNSRLERTPGIHKYAKVEKKITPDNVVKTLKENNTPEKFLALNLDIDGYDLFVLINILKEFKPSIIITEINEIIPPDVYFSVTYDENYAWASNNFFGYGIACLEPVLEKFGYTILTLAYNNAIIIKNDTAFNVKEIYNEGYLNAPERKTTFHYNTPYENWTESDIKNHYSHRSNFVMGDDCLNLINKTICQ